MNELTHHGIKGQKWGHKNGPPYPLDESDYSAEEKRKNTTIRGKLGGQMKLNLLDQRRAEEKVSAENKRKKYENYKTKNQYRERTARRERKEDRLLKKYEKAKGKEKLTKDKIDKTIRDLEKKGYKISTKAGKRDTSPAIRDMLDYAVGGPIGGSLINMYRLSKQPYNGTLYKVDRNRPKKKDYWKPVNTGRRTQGRRRNKYQ